MEITGYDEWELAEKREILYEFAWSLRAKINRLFTRDERKENTILEALYHSSLKDSGRLLRTNDPSEVLHIEGRLYGLKNIISVLEELKNES